MTILRGSRWRALVASALLLVAACSGDPGATTSPSPTGSPTLAPSATLTATPDATPTGRPSPSDSPSPSVGSPSPVASTPPAPSAYAWTELPVADGPPAREDHTLTLGGDGAAYLFGGRNGNRTFDDVWRLDLATGTWQQLSPEGAVPAARFGHVAVWIEGIGLVVWSGQAGPNTFFDDIWAYDPTGLAWTQLPNGGDVPLARYGSCGAVGPDGRLWISHGFTADEGRFFDTRAYDFESGSWADLTGEPSEAPVLRCLHDCLWTPAGQFVLYGGQTTGVPAVGDMWTRSADDAPGGWQQQPEPPAPARQLYALGVLGDRAFIFGGGGRNGRPLGDLWVLDLASLAMSEATVVGPAPSARSGATFVADPTSGRLLLFGGKGGGGELADLWQLVPVAP